MAESMIVAIFSAVFCAGSVYGIISTRLKNLESKIKRQEEHGDRLTRVETKLDILLEHLIKD